MRAVLELREENARLSRREQATRKQLERLRERLEKARQDTRRARGQTDAVRGKLAAARRRVEELRQVLAEVRSERNDLRRRFALLDDAAVWLDQESQREGSRADVVLRARVTAASFVEALSRGEDPNVALVEYARGLTHLKIAAHRYRISALAGVLEQFESLRTGVNAALVVHYYYVGHRDLARHHLELCGDEALKLVPVEYARLRVAEDPTTAGAVFDRLVQLASPTPDQWLDILSVIAASRDLAELARATDALAEQATTWDASQQRVFARFVEYGARAGQVPTPQAADVTFGVMGYRRADVRTSSRNIGDFVQTLSVLGHLLRRSGVRFVGEPDLVKAAETLRSRVRPDLVVDGDDATVALVEVSRDDSSLDVIPPCTWYIAFGWHLHADAIGGHGLPYHPNLRPIFVSLHMNRRDMLSDEAVEYLRRYAPIGCRDWYTVDMLTRLGVPAFFTGCITTTIDGFFDDDFDGDGRGEGFVDTHAPGGAPGMEQEYDEVRHRSLAENLEAALTTFDDYRSRFGSLTTSRLHCYLPATSIGIPTTFRQKQPFNLRFEGLTDPGADLDAMRVRLRHTLLEPVLTSILSGAGEDEVYKQWRAITEPLVAADAAVRDAAYEWPSTALDIPATVDKIREAAWSRPVAVDDGSERIDVGVVLDRNYLTQLYTVLDRCLAHVSRPVRVSALVRGLTTSDFEQFARAFPEIDVTFLPCDLVDYGNVAVRASHISLSTMDRLLLPELLPGLDKVLYLDLDLLPRADIAELFDTELGNAPLAARPSNSLLGMGGLASFASVAKREFRDSDSGWRLLNLVHRHSHVADRGFNAGVLVMNLRRMRDDGFVDRYAGLVEQFGLNDQYVLNLYAGDSVVPIDSRWNAWPDKDVLDDDAAIVHWLGPRKPWGPLRVAFQDEWRDAVAAVELRRTRQTGDA